MQGGVDYHYLLYEIDVRDFLQLVKLTAQYLKDREKAMKQNV